MQCRSTLVSNAYQVLYAARERFRMAALPGIIAAVDTGVNIETPVSKGGKPRRIWMARGNARIMKTSGYVCYDCRAPLTPSQRQNKASSVAFRSWPNVWETFVWRFIKVSEGRRTWPLQRCIWNLLDGLVWLLSNDQKAFGGLLWRTFLQSVQIYMIICSRLQWKSHENQSHTHTNVFFLNISYYLFRDRSIESMKHNMKSSGQVWLQCTDALYTLHVKQYI